jgi:hypothetical protein
MCIHISQNIDKIARATWGLWDEIKLMVIDSKINNPFLGSLEVSWYRIQT